MEASRARDRVRDAFAVDGKERQGTRTDLEPSANLAESDRTPQETRKLSAAGTGYSGSTLDKVDQIRSAAERGVVKQGKTEREVPAEVREVAQRGLDDVSETGADADSGQVGVVPPGAATPSGLCPAPRGRRGAVDALSDPRSAAPTARHRHASDRTR